MFKITVAEAAPQEQQPALDLLLDPSASLPILLLVARSANGELLGAALCQPLPGAGAVVWPPAILTSSTPTTIEDALLASVLDRLRRRGTKVTQAFLDPTTRPAAAALERHGFRHLTRLYSMRCELFRPPSDKEALQSSLRLVSYPNCDAATFQQTLMRTYQGTLDAPELNGVRTPDEIIAGLRAEAPDLQRWWLAEWHNQPAGVLVLADGAARGEWQLSYFGIIPEMRGRGLGTILLRHAKDFALVGGASELALIVDSRNQPALDLYVTHGFRTYGLREVYLRLEL
jgi:mycothiol synthase